jgi:hypothetical protein
LPYLLQILGVWSAKTQSCEKQFCCGITDLRPVGSLRTSKETGSFGGFAGCDNANEQGLNRLGEQS